MGREIKFRFWDSIQKRMDETVDGREGITLNDSLESLLEYDYVIIQYTGLKDKNGVEIFEGDVRREEIEYEEGDERTYFVCTWIKELAMFSWLTVPEYLEYTDDDPQTFDVIFPTENPYPLDVSEIQYYVVCGNVFENPGLLEPIPHK